jgi:uncharacterized protein (DUF697 family)
LRPSRPLFTGCLAVSLSALAPALLARPFPTAAIAAAAAVGLGAVGFSNTLWFTALQERIPANALSRVSSYDWLGSLVLQPAGYALAAPAVATIGVAATLLGGAAAQASICIGFALPSAVRCFRSEEHPEPEPGTLGNHPKRDRATLVSASRSGS